jgi:hypothetical protein
MIGPESPRPLRGIFQAMFSVSPHVTGGFSPGATDELSLPRN